MSEYQRHRLCCPTCGETTCAELPVGVPQGQSGPRLMAFTALLMAFYRQSKRRTAGETPWLAFAARDVRVVRAWADYRPGRISRAALLHRMGPVRRKVECLLLRGTQSGNRDVRGTCRELYEHGQWLWTFLRHEEIEPTNNAGERALRHAVIWRKLSFGTQSATGSRFVETMLTVIETCRQQGRNVFAFLTAAVEAHLGHQPAPSLLSGV